MDFFISNAFAEGAPGAAGGGLEFLMMIGIFFAIMYFMIIRPQSKRAKEHKALLEGLKKGDEVINNGGTLGRITDIGESFVTMEISTGVEMQVQLDKLEAIVKTAGVDYKSAALEEGRALVRFSNTDQQILAMDAVRESLGSQYVAALNLAPATPGWLRSLNAQPMYLGLDLRGGVHFLLEVDMPAALENAYERSQADFRTSLREADVRYLGVVRDGETLEVKFRAGELEVAQAGLDALRKDFRADYDLVEDFESDPLVIRATLKEQAKLDIQSFALKQNITSLRKRVNELGVAEPIIQQQGMNRIVVELPGVQDTARAKRILGATATLEFRL
ncbi:unnamed protein product, partial [Cyprideis torosa]